MKITLEQLNTCEDLVKRRILSELQTIAVARRERAALRILPGVISSESHRGRTMEEKVFDAVRYADLLLAVLDKS